VTIWEFHSKFVCVEVDDVDDDVVAVVVEGV
jgi:hypothetical protein